MATINDLSHEMLVEIFSHYVRSEGHDRFLRNIPGVCKDWNKVSAVASLWRDVMAYDWNFLLNVSRRELLYHTHRLEIFVNERRFHCKNLSPVLRNILDLKALDLMGKAMSGAAIKLVAKHCPHLECLRLLFVEVIKTTSHEWDQLLTVCGPTLKDLDLTCSGSKEVVQQLISGIAAKCPHLERLAFSLDYGVKFPIHELQSGCPRLRELKFSHCDIITTVNNDSFGCGFKHLSKFEAKYNNFGDLDLYMLLKDSTELECLELFGNRNLVYSNICKIPSDKLRILDIGHKDLDNNLNALGDAVFNWRHTLSVLNLRDWECDVSCVLQRLLQDNPNPQLERLTIYKKIDLRFFGKFVQKCKKLTHLEIQTQHGELFTSHFHRHDFKDALEFLKKRQ